MNWFLASLSLLLISCSSTEQIHYYKVNRPGDITKPEITYKVDSVYYSRPKSTLSLNYKRRTRLFQVARSQSVVITVEHYAAKPYTFGPLFLPFIPVFGLGDTPPLNKEEKLSITVGASADPEFGVKVLSIPDVEITTPELKVLRPEEVGIGGNFKRFTYDIEVKDLPFFWINLAQVETDKSPMVIPKLRFDLVREFNYECCVPIAP